MIKVAIYCRLSDEDKNKKSVNDDSESIQNQKNLLMNYALEKGWDIYKIYSDDDYSGLDADRPEFNAMLKDAEAGKFNTILCKTQSRFTRDMELVEKYLHNKFVEWEVRFISVVDGMDTDDKHNKKSRQIYGLTNEWYCEEISESIKSTLKSKQEIGEFIGSFACYGYDKDPNDKNKLIIDNDVAEDVILIYSLYLQGYGTQKIANFLNEKRIPNPTKYKENKGFKYKNTAATDDFGLWNKVTIKRILKSQMYIGNMVQHVRAKLNYKSKKIKTLHESKWIIVKNTHEPIISEKDFYMVQTRMESNIRSSGKGEIHLFAGKVKCIDCNSTMNKMSNGKSYVYLRCKLYNTRTREKLCTSHSIRLDLLEEVVTNKMKTYINSLCDDNNLCNKLVYENKAQDKMKILTKQLDDIDKEIKNKSEVLRNLYLDKVKGTLSELQFTEFNSMFLAEKEELFLKREKLEKELIILKEKASSTKYFEDVIKKYKNFDELTSTMVNELIDYIEIGEKDTKTQEQQIKIFWNF